MNKIKAHGYEPQCWGSNPSSPTTLQRDTDISHVMIRSGLSPSWVRRTSKVFLDIVYVNKQFDNVDLLSLLGGGVGGIE